MYVSIEIPMLANSEVTNAKSVRVGLDDLEVEITVERTDEGVVLRLGGATCNLEGEMPGEYWLTPLDDAQQRKQRLLDLTDESIERDVLQMDDDEVVAMLRDFGEVSAS